MKTIELHEGPPPVSRDIPHGAAIVVQTKNGTWFVLTWKWIEPYYEEDDYPPSLSDWYEWERGVTGEHVVLWGWLD